MKHSAAMTRLPRGYVGINHQTIGSDILAVLNVIHAPERTLGPDLAGRLAKVKADEWYPISLLLEALETLDKKLDKYALKNAGWKLFSLSHAENAKKTVKSARDIVYGFNGMYLNANRGVRIGGWNVLSFEPGRAEMEKTTPHHCVLEEGIVEEALRMVGANAKVEQSQCFRNGADSCVFLITSPAPGPQWG